MRVTAALSLLLWSSTVDAAKTITPSNSCFTIGKFINLSFQDSSPKVGDWIGVVQSSANVFGSVNYPQFVFTCGTASCSGAPASGSVSMFNNLPAGNYKAVLLPANSFAPSAVSSTFSIHTSCAPTPPTRPTPVAKPVPSPVARPTPVARPVAKPTSKGINLAAAAQALAGVDAAVLPLVQRDSTLLPQFLRMIFHDCHNKCDGCIDLTNQDNSRLGNPIKLLAPIVAQFANPQTGLSRGDVWVQAMYTALNAASKRGTLTSDPTPITFTMNWVGRVDCEKAGTTCRNSKGQLGCSATTGPHRNMASVNMNSNGFANFWQTTFNGMSLRNGIALIGCHTVGRLFSQDTGIDGPNGWVLENTPFTNEYYQALLGSAATPDMSADQLFSVSPNWANTFQANGGNIPDRNFFTLDANGKRLVMTDADIAIARQLDSSNTDSNGAVSCAFNQNTAGKGATVCPMSNNINILQQFLDIDTYFNTLKGALDLMVTNGYTQKPCGGSLCTLG